MLDNPVALVVAILGSAGLGGFFREIMTSVKQFRSGVSTKEAQRKRDLVSERDYEYDRAEAEARNRRRLEEYSSTLKMHIIEGKPSTDIPKFPTLEEIPERKPSPQVPGSSTEQV